MNLADFRRCFAKVVIFHDTLSSDHYTVLEVGPPINKSAYYSKIASVYFMECLFISTCSSVYLVKPNFLFLQVLILCSSYFCKCCFIGHFKNFTPSRAACAASPRAACVASAANLAHVACATRSV